MLSEYKCTIKCFWRDGLVKEGQTVLADDSEMKGNNCFTKLKSEAKVEAKAEKKVEEKPKKATLKNILGEV